MSEENKEPLGLSGDNLRPIIEWMVGLFEKHAKEISDIKTVCIHLHQRVSALESKQDTTKGTPCPSPTPPTNSSTAL